MQTGGPLDMGMGPPMIGGPMGGFPPMRGGMVPPMMMLANGGMDGFGSGGFNGPMMQLGRPDHAAAAFGGAGQGFGAVGSMRQRRPLSKEDDPLAGPRKSMIGCAIHLVAFQQS